MHNQVKPYALGAGALFLAFVLFTLAVAFADVQTIGPEGTAVGFAALNGAVLRLTGVNLIWYHITDWLGVAAVLCALGFAILGLCQLIGRRSLRKVDRSLLLLGAFYLTVIAVYLFFERAAVNYRPVLLGAHPEASYPSSHTVIVLCILGTAVTQFRRRLAGRRALLHLTRGLSVLVMAVTVAGRLISGVHWCTDIVGGLLLAGALTAGYRAATEKWPDA